MNSIILRHEKDQNCLENSYKIQNKLKKITSAKLRNENHNNPSDFLIGRHFEKKTSQISHHSFDENSQCV